MRLSEKGYEKVFAWSGTPTKIEFDQGDFEGAVVLTLDEAIGLKQELFRARSRSCWARELYNTLWNKVHQAELDMSKKSDSVDTFSHCVHGIDI